MSLRSFQKFIHTSMVSGSSDIFNSVYGDKIFENMDWNCVSSNHRWHLKYTNPDVRYNFCNNPCGDNCNRKGSGGSTESFYDSDNMNETMWGWEGHHTISVQMNESMDRWICMFSNFVLWTQNSLLRKSFYGSEHVTILVVAHLPDCDKHLNILRKDDVI